MTAEIAVLNREAVALAADSAVTFTGLTGNKIFSSANKLFSLSKYHPIGIMIYNNALFMGVPWEQVIKIYRDYLGATNFSTTEEFAEDFINYVGKHKVFNAEEEQMKYVSSQIEALYGLIRDHIIDKITRHGRRHQEYPIEKRDVQKILDAVVNDMSIFLYKAERLSSLPKRHEETIKRIYQDVIREKKKFVFEKLPISSATSRKLTEIAAKLFTTFAMQSSLQTGVVVAGFGKDDIFPSIYSYLLEGTVAGKLKYVRVRDTQISRSVTSSVLPFAQQEMVYSFMEGVNPDYQQIIDESIEQIISRLPEEIIDSIDKLSDEEKQAYKVKLGKANQRHVTHYLQELRKFRKVNFSEPVVRVVDALPKEELASMAESLVNITAFRRKVSLDEETVTHPIDVAVITKGDGLVWIKRKHYFDPTLNHQFFANYNLGG